MKIWLTFCLFFIAAPVLINTFLRISQIIKGPRDDSVAQLEVYQKRLRKLLIELGVMFLLLLGMGGILLLTWLDGGR